MEASKQNAAYDLFDVLADMLEEYEFDAEWHEKRGWDMGRQRNVITRARDALNKFKPGYITKPTYWEKGNY